jgi:hypothetical protein
MEKAMEVCQRSASGVGRWFGVRDAAFRHGPSAQMGAVTRFLIDQSPVYSNRSASIGSRRAARRAG